MTLILCFVYAQKKGFTFASGMPKLNWESFPSEKEPKKNDNLKKEDNNHPKKDEKIELMHIAICRLLEPYGYYEFEFFDNDGWPHYKVKEELPPLKAGEQAVLMKEAIVNYFLERELID